MTKILSIVSALLLTIPAFAGQTLSEVVLQAQLKSYEGAREIDWKPGDTASYNVDMGFIKGTMIARVDSNDGNEVWLSQDMDLGFAGKQQTQTLLDAQTGEVKKVLVNGQEQEMPEQNYELIEIVDDTITVPAGTFKCMHVRFTDKSNNGEINMWQSNTVPMSGMVKQIAPSQFGKVTVELTSYNKQ